MYTPPPPPKHVPQPVPAIVERMPPRTQSETPFQFDINSKEPVVSFTVQQPEPEKPEPSLMQKYVAFNEWEGVFEGPIKEVLDNKEKADKNNEEMKAQSLPGYEDHPPDEPSPETDTSSAKETIPEQDTAPKQAEAAVPDANVENSNESESSNAGSSNPPEPTKETTPEQESASNENVNNIAEPVSDAYEKKGEIDEKVGTGNASDVAAGSGDLPEPSQEKAKEQEPSSEKSTAPNQAEAAAPSEGNSESGSSSQSVDDGCDRFNGITF
jgi:hypothetical protein